MCKFLADVNALNLTDEDLGAGRNGYACEFGNLSSLLTNDLCVECAVDDDGLTNLFSLLSFLSLSTMQ